MSEFRIGLISEGPTDLSVLQKIITTSFPQDSFVFSYISPTEDEIKESKKEEGFGWGGVYKVCKRLDAKLDIAEMAGRGFDLLVIHLDGDVMMVSYDSARIDPEPSDAPLPSFNDADTISGNCSCLKSVAESWINGISNINVVFCIPYINTDVWVAYMFYPSKRDLFFEELDKESLNRILLGMRKKDGRLVRKKGGEIKKNHKAYLDACDYLTNELLEKMKEVFSQLNLFCKELVFDLV